MKKLIYLAIFAAGLFLVSCSGSTVKPTGDVEKDAKALMDYQLQATKDMKAAFADFKITKATEIGEEMDKVEKAFDEFYSKNAELKDKFDAAVEKIRPEYDKQYEQMGEEILGKLGGLFSDLTDDSEGAAEEVQEVVEEAAE